MKPIICLDEHDDAAAYISRLQAVLPAETEPVLVHVVNPLTDAADRFALTSAEAVAQVASEWEARLASVAAEMPHQASSVVLELPHGEDIADAILRFAHEQEADLIALGTRRGGSLRGMLLGSVADEVMRKSDLPVLVVHLPR